MIERARNYAEEAGFRAQFICSDVDEWESTQHFDLIYFSPFMYGCYHSRERRVDLLRRVSRWLAVDGIIVLSHRLRDEPHGFDRYLAVAKVAAALTGGNRKVQPGDRIVYPVFEHFFAEREADTESEGVRLRCLQEMRAPGVGLVFHVLRWEGAPSARTADSVAADSAPHQADSSKSSRPSTPV